MAKLVKIDYYYKGPVLFSIAAEIDGKDVDITIRKADFERFVDTHRKREWIENSDEKVTWDQYYDSKFVLEDLQKFISQEYQQIGEPLSKVRPLKTDSLFTTLGHIFNPSRS